MQSLWARYHEETEGHEVLEEDYGFIRFEIASPLCLIHDLYVIPERRREGLARVLADRVTRLARSKGCTQLLSEIGLKSKTADEAILANSAYGFKVRQETDRFILMHKPISKG